MADLPPEDNANGPCNVLIVDDEDAIRDSMRELVRRAGYGAHSAGSAEEALDLLRTAPMDVVISDIQLPGMDGLALTDEIRRHHDSEVIVMTGYSGDYSYEDAVHKGASDFVFKPVRFEELLLRLRRVLRERSLRRERDRMVQRLQELAITDGLTRLYNSRHFYHLLEVEVGRCQRYHHLLALLLMDIDHFKDYNDSYGHLEGDKVLVCFGQLIKSCLRHMDAAFRYGGEEFTVILPETSGSEAMTVAHRIKDSVQAKRFHPTADQTVQLTISVGVTQYVPGEDRSAFVQRADQAMYVSKQSGRNRVTLLPAA
jgi:diguanylate cyclase (GGDEF)-like protein